MSVDARVTKDLMETLQDGQDGFTKSAEKLADSDAPEVATTFRGFAEQRSRFYAELDKLAQDYGDDIDDSGSAGATIHRGWISLKDALTGSSPKSVLKAAETGEDHAVKEYEKALGEELSAGLRTVVERQSHDITAARDEVKALVAAHD